MGFSVSAKKRVVIFECPHCTNELRSPFEEAGTKQRCPTCQRSFIVPGKEEVAALVDEEAFRAEVARREAEELSLRQAEERRKNEQSVEAQRAAQTRQAAREAREQAPAVPDYAGLRLASSVLHAFAAISYIIGAIALFAALFGTANASVVEKIALAASGLSSLLAGAVLHAFSAACEALRDIARNSFK